MRDIHDQIHQTIKKSQRVLLTCRQDASVDSLASCLSTYLFLDKIGIKADVVLPHDHKAEKLSFLPAVKEVKEGFPGDGNGLVIHVRHPGAKVGKFRYDVTGETLNIYITPEHGRFEASDVVAEDMKPKYDLIIACDTPDLASLGKLYKDHVSFFLQTPIINIDHSPANELYGHINHVDITHVSTTELLFHLFEDIADEHIDKEVATALLAGMISKTHSFRTPNVTPRSLMVASELVQRGGRRDEIIKHLYRQHELSTLRLWGRVLARLQFDKDKQFVWSQVKRDDFERAGAEDDSLPGLIEELIATTPQAKYVALVYEKSEGGIGGWLKTDPHTSALKLTEKWQSTGTKNLAQFTITGKNIDEAVTAIKQALPFLPEI
jgi:bifunctional oligoribonuclease and PAP phosphatase NrnA